MKCYGTERSDMLTCDLGCCVMHKNPAGHKPKFSRKALRRRARSKARQEARADIREQV
jgi:hypothetical protein